jgi:hypothetical protein
MSMRVHVFGTFPDPRSQHLWDLLRTSPESALPVSASYAHERRGARVTFEIGGNPARRNETAPATLRLLRDAEPEPSSQATQRTLPSAAA